MRIQRDLLVHMVNSHQSAKQMSTASKNCVQDQSQYERMHSPPYWAGWVMYLVHIPDRKVWMDFAELNWCLILLAIAGFDSQKLSRLPLWPRSLALFLCLVVSGLMHELIFFYMTLSPPTWDATAFFTLHGIMSVFEIVIRRKFRIKVIKLVSVPITLCVMFFSALWLFYPSVCRGGTDFKAISEFQHFFRNFLPQYYPS